MSLENQKYPLLKPYMVDKKKQIPTHLTNLPFEVLFRLSLSSATMAHSTRQFTRGGGRKNMVNGEYLLNVLEYKPTIEAP